MKGKVAPMSVMKRVSLIFKSKANKALDKMEDPRETLDYSYQRQLEMLTQVRRGVADVATSRKRVELQINTLQRDMDKRDGQARQALGNGREDVTGPQRDDIQAELDQMRGGQDVELELERLKGEIGAAPAREIEGGPAADSATASSATPATPATPADQPQAGESS